ncbi:hypothetical protein SHIRM173S_00491 [Streptomyces hirsutus]
MKRTDDRLLPVLLICAQAVVWPGAALVRGTVPTASALLVAVLVAGPVAAALALRRTRPVTTLVLVAAACALGAGPLPAGAMAVLGTAGVALALFTVAAERDTFTALLCTVALAVWQVLYWISLHGLSDHDGLDLVLTALLYVLACGARPVRTADRHARQRGRTAPATAPHRPNATGFRQPNDSAWNRRVATTVSAHRRDGRGGTAGAPRVRLAEELAPDVVVMDVRMPELDGIAATRIITGRENAPRVLVLTTFDLDVYVFDALRAGASGFLLKDVHPAELLRHRVVASGESVLSPSATRRLIGHYASGEPTRIHAASDHHELDSLTARERFVLTLVASAAHQHGDRRRTPASTVGTVEVPC